MNLGSAKGGGKHIGKEFAEVKVTRENGKSVYYQFEII